MLENEKDKKVNNDNKLKNNLKRRNASNITKHNSPFFKKIKWVKKYIDENSKLILNWILIVQFVFLLITITILLVFIQSIKMNDSAFWAILSLMSIVNLILFLFLLIRLGPWNKTLNSKLYMKYFFLFVICIFISVYIVVVSLMIIYYPKDLSGNNTSSPSSCFWIIFFLILIELSFIFPIRSTAFFWIIYTVNNKNFTQLNSTQKKERKIKLNENFFNRFLYKIENEKYLTDVFDKNLNIIQEDENKNDICKSNKSNKTISCRIIDANNAFYDFHNDLLKIIRTIAIFCLFVRKECQSMYLFKIRKCREKINNFWLENKHKILKKSSDFSDLIFSKWISSILIIVNAVLSIFGTIFLDNLLNLENNNPLKLTLPIISTVISISFTITAYLLEKDKKRNELDYRILLFDEVYRHIFDDCEFDYRNTKIFIPNSYTKSNDENNKSLYTLEFNLENSELRFDEFQELYKTLNFLGVSKFDTKNNKIVFVNENLNIHLVLNYSIKNETSKFNNINRVCRYSKFVSLIINQERELIYGGIRK